MKSIKDMSMEELGAYVCSALEKEGVDTVLSGGCCVEIYSHGRYTSDDIDRFNGGYRKIKAVMAKLGFREHKMRHLYL
jgi:methylmalonyl-CoA mutase cobalamin-binding subunit